MQRLPVQRLGRATLFLSFLLFACSSSDDGSSSDPGSGVAGAGGDATSSGGVANGSGGTSGGSSSVGGSATGGSATGGSAAGGSASGGSADGGSSTGGIPSVGGNDTGGVSSGGVGAGQSGGAASGGTNGTGGTTNTGGAPSGGTSSTGGSAGSGGGGSEVPDTTQCQPYADWDDAWTAKEEEVLAIVNQNRLAGADCVTASPSARSPVGALKMDPLLRCAARLHAKDMVDRDYFSHGTWDDNGAVCVDDSTCGDGQLCSNKIGKSTPERCLDGPGSRLDYVGWSGMAWGENIAAGNSTAAATMTQWMNSAGHCDNIMDGVYTKIGIAYVPGGTYGHMWVQVFGK